MFDIGPGAIFAEHAALAAASHLVGQRRANLDEIRALCGGLPARLGLRGGSDPLLNLR